MSINKVLYNVDQRNDTTAAEKATARANIGAQGALTAGSNITISNGTISAANTEYQAGHGLTLSNNTFAVDDTVLQGKLTAGANIQIHGNTISATDTTYTAGSNVQISSDNVISATDTTYTAGSGLALNGTEFSNTAPNVKADWDAAAGSDAEILNKPTIPTVNDGTLTIQKNGTNVATFSANQSGSATANITVPTDTSDLTNGAGYITASQVPAQVNADWNASSGSAEILNKPSLQFKPYGGTAGNMTSLLLDADDPEGYIELGVNGGSLGKLVAGPYAGLLNSGVNGVGDSATPIYINSSGQFATASALPTVEYISFNYSNETTAQDSVYTAIVNAYTAGKLPILYCGVANATLYWIPTAHGANGYSFSRTVSNYSYVVTVDATSHVISHQYKEIINYTAGSNISIDANNQISATDTTYTAGSFININSNNVISNTMHQDTVGLMISYNTLSNAGTTTHSWGPWRIQITKRAMATWDDGTGNNPSIYVQVAHSDYISGTITNGRVQHVNYYPWKDGVMDQVFTGHVQWPFDGSYAQGGSNNGFPIDLTSPMDPDGNARACPRSMRALHLIYNCGIDSPDWLDINIEPLYVNNNTSINSNAARLLIRAKYFYV